MVWHLAYLAQNVNLIDGGTNLYPLQTEALLSGILAVESHLPYPKILGFLDPLIQAQNSTYSFARTYSN